MVTLKFYDELFQRLSQTTKLHEFCRLFFVLFRVISWLNFPVVKSETLPKILRIQQNV